MKRLINILRVERIPPGVDLVTKKKEKKRKKKKKRNEVAVIV